MVTPGVMLIFKVTASDGDVPAQSLIYTLDSLPQLRGHTWAYRLFEYGNVATPFVIALQDLLYYGRVPKLAIMVYVLGAGVFVLVGGYMLFNRLQRNLAVEL